MIDIAAEIYSLQVWFHVPSSVQFVSVWFLVEKILQCLVGLFRVS